MTTEYRSAPLTEGNFKATRITVSPFIPDLPPDVVGGAGKDDLAPRSLTLHWGRMRIETDLPTDSRSGRPRGFLRDRGEFTRAILTEAELGDVVVFEKFGSHEFRLHLEKPAGRRISAADPTSREKERIRKWALRETRPDQQEFRRKVAERDGLKCVISGCDIAEILDAAHLAPRSPGGPDDPSNGMILRVDLHRLLDASLMSLDSAGVAAIASDVLDPEYRRFHGASIRTGADLSHLAARGVRDEE